MKTTVQIEPARPSTLGICRNPGRTTLTETESKQLLHAYGIALVDARVPATAREAALAPDEIGYPVVLKLNSCTITHKSNVGGVILNIRSRSFTYRGPAWDVACVASGI